MDEKLQEAAEAVATSWGVAATSIWNHLTIRVDGPFASKDAAIAYAHKRNEVIRDPHIYIIVPITAPEAL